MLTKVYGGTETLEGASLCDTCKQSRVTRGRRTDEEIVICNATPMRAVRVTFKVTCCSDYLDCREPSYMELFERAWILRPSSKRRPAGFVRASDLEDDEAMRLRLEARSHD
jgi:hypothetical protein